MSLKTGVVPQLCKFAQVTPILKGGNDDDPNNYRPISILPVIAKCIEYFVNEQLTNYFENNNLLTKHQYGFRKNNSTTYLMFDLFDNIYDSKSSSKVPAILFLDIKKAFDTVDHEILIEKLKFYGVDGTVILWFKNYLENRYQCTRLGSKVSNYLVIKCGVPQGSSLGPLLFSIFINDLEKACNLAIPYLFADDGALFFSDICRKTYLNIKIEMMTIMKWLDVNKLSLSIDKHKSKTQFLVFDNEEYIDCIDLGNGIKISECKSVKYLGLIVDNLLKFDLHIEHIKKKVQKRIGAMYRGSSLLPIKYRKMFANALMLPQFDYLDTIYGRASKSKLRELDIMYKKVAKIALGVDKTENSLSVYKDMKWFTIHLRRQLPLSSYFIGSRLLPLY
ncbi:MAG: reverse transcriptase family protein, partial [Aureispira sp.]|nr:reverse transcriptase family protein [Aureispira sp.]